MSNIGVGANYGFDVPTDPNNMLHAGSWGGLPDFGVTEALGKVLGTSTTAQGGSNLVNRAPVQTAPAPAPAPAPTNKSGFDMKYYQGWDPNAAMADWNATGGAKANVGVGTNQPDLMGQYQSSVDSAFNPLFDQLDKMMGGYKDWQMNQQGLIDQLFGTQKSELDTNLNNSLQTLDPQRTRVEDEKAKGIRGIQDGLQQMLQAGNNYLGLSGAGDSSAAGMYNYALNKQSLRNIGDVTTQAQNLLGQIDQKATEIRGTYDQNLKQLGTWKAEQLANLGTQVQTALQNLQAQRANAVGQKAQMLAQAAQGVMQDAMARTREIEASARQWTQGMQSWALQRMANLDDMKLKLGQMGNFDPGSVTAKEMTGFSQLTSKDPSQYYSNINPALLQKRRDQPFTGLGA